MIRICHGDIVGRMLAPSRVALLLTGSGFCALVYQIAWFRSLRLVFGASTSANAAVLAIFMGGLGLGGWLLGRRADRTENPLLMYGNLELGIALLAAMSPFLLDLVRAGYIASGGTLALGSVFGTAIRLFGAVLVLGGPVVLMGGTLPAATRACMASSDTNRGAMALLYGANTFGSVAGAFLGTFFLIEILGTRNTLLAAACLNALIALIARAMSRGQKVDVEVAPAVRAPVAAQPEVRPPSIIVMIAAAVVGFAFLLMELVWYRMLGPILGGSSYTFGMILICALLGIGIGGFIYSRRDGKKPVTVQLFALTCAAEALFFGVPLAIGDDLAMWALFLQHLDHLGFPGLVMGWLAINSLVVLPGAIVAGYQFPLLVALLGGGREGVGRELGLTYAWNTVGAIVGSLAGGFGLLPLLTAPGAWRMVIIVLLLLAGLSLLSIGRRAIDRRSILPAVLALLAIYCVMAPGPGAVWRHGGIGAGRAPSKFDNRMAIKDWMHQQYNDIVWEVEGVESSVALNDATGYAFIINGKTDGNARHDAGTQVMLGLLGAILHPEPKSGFVIGLGTGSSAGWLGKVPSIERVDVVELEEAVLRVAKDCELVNEDVLNNDRVNVIIGDAREVLPTTDRSYDLIMSEPSNPYRAGIGSMFTQEFYQSVDE
ncbi:MAG: spermidine synthase, partial [Myxococcota bacterium]